MGTRVAWGLTGVPDKGVLIPEARGVTGVPFPARGVACLMLAADVGVDTGLTRAWPGVDTRPGVLE